MTTLVYKESDENNAKIFQDEKTKQYYKEVEGELFEVTEEMEPLCRANLSMPIVKTFPL